jgi:hypothetical protein
MNREFIINTFVKNFILKDKRERCLAELLNSKKRRKFTDKLNHQWLSILDSRCLKLIANSEDSSNSIKLLFGFPNDALCYIISDNSDYDDKFLSFQEAFDALYGWRAGTIILNQAVNIFFLETEEPSKRFIGRIV